MVSRSFLALDYTLLVLINYFLRLLAAGFRYFSDLSY